MTNLPSPADQPDPRPELRASDQDREAVAEQLREAAAEGRIDLDELQERLDRVFTAKTYGDLEPITADLPHHAELAVSPVTARDDEPPVVMNGGTAGDDRRGRWKAPRRLEAHGGIGGIKLDFTQAELPGPVVDLDLHGDVGGVTVVVPPGMRVELLRSSPGMGGVRNKTTEGPQPPRNAPLLRVTCAGGLGGVTVRYPNRWEQWRQQRANEQR